MYPQAAKRAFIRLFAWRIPNHAVDKIKAVLFSFFIQVNTGDQLFPAQSPSRLLGPVPTTLPEFRSVVSSLPLPLSLRESRSQGDF